MALGQAFGTSAGTQTFKSVEHSDVILVIGANPGAAHPVFALRMKKRLRQVAQLIVIDPRQIDLVQSPHVQAQFHLQLRKLDAHGSVQWPVLPVAQASAWQRDYARFNKAQLAHLPAAGA